MGDVDDSALAEAYDLGATIAAILMEQAGR